MSRRGGPAIVLGVGNVLLRDEGIGVHVVRALDGLAAAGAVELPRNTRLVDGGTLGVDLLPLVASARALVVVDALVRGGVPGSVEVLDGETMRRAVGTSTRRDGLGDLIAAALVLEALPEASALVGVEPAEIAPGLDLTEEVRTAVPAAIRVVLETLRRLDPGPSSSAAHAAVARPELAGVVR